MANTVDLRTPKSEGEWISNKSKATSSYTPNTVQVNSDGSAPSGLSAGTLVNTAGGAYRIDSVNPDGTYNSTHLKDYTPSGGTYGGTGSGGGTPSSTASGSMRSGSLYTIDDILNNRRANLMGLGIGDMYGITYDQDKLLKVYNQATDAQYALKQKEQQIAENKYYQNLYNTQNSTIDALRAQRNSQIASGMSAGLAAAADSATAMGIQQEGAAGALELANARQTMADEIAAAYAQNIVSALQDSNTLRAQIAGLDLNKYGYDTNFDAAFAGAVPLFNEAIGNLEAAYLGYQANKDNLAMEQQKIDKGYYSSGSGGGYYGGGYYGGYSTPSTTTTTTPENVDENYPWLTKNGDLIPEYFINDAGQIDESLFKEKMGLTGLKPGDAVYESNLQDIKKASIQQQNRNIYNDEKFVNILPNIIRSHSSTNSHGYTDIDVDAVIRDMQTKYKEVYGNAIFDDTEIEKLRKQLENMQLTRIHYELVGDTSVPSGYDVYDISKPITINKNGVIQYSRRYIPF